MSPPSPPSPPSPTIDLRSDTVTKPSPAMRRAMAEAEVGDGWRGRAWEIRKRLGGGMRQSAILAAAALYALDHTLDRIGEDHGDSSDSVAPRLAQSGVRVVPFGPRIIVETLR